MKRSVILALGVLLCCYSFMLRAEDEAEADITFRKTAHNFGTFTTDDAVQSCIFKFFNSGNAPLAISQVVATCGCTVPEYSTEQIAPGDSGMIKVTYNGQKANPGYFNKVITVRSNAKHKLVRLSIEGTMVEAAKD